jgi:predicted metalloprotease
MRWQGRAGSGNVLDRRTGGVVLGGGTIIVALIAICLGADPMSVLDMVESGGVPGTQVSAPANDQLGQMVSVVLADTERVWTDLFAREGRDYPEPKLVLFDGAVQTACGSASAAVGPFYCPSDQQVYLDLSFANDLAARFGAPGDFAIAYVVAHEVGHHVQQMTGRLSGGRVTNQKSVQQELQADCLAGVWAHHANVGGLLERGDLQDGRGAAAAVGDDRLQRASQGVVVPDSFTHGSSAQRVAAFQTGWASGEPRSCDDASTARR